MPDASGVFSTEPKYWWRNFKAIWHVDFEYRQDANHLPVPVCMRAYADNRSKSAPAKEIQSARGATMERVDALDS
ncbi:MAG: hypothetical protein ACXWI1_02220 [Croceibacterium sp.]|jgi:hypothetical protein